MTADAELDPISDGLTALIPLDGSRLSESAFSLLPVIRTLGFNKIKLVSVWEQVWGEAGVGRSEGEIKEVTESGRAYLRAYLDSQSERIGRSGFAVDTAVRVGRAAEETLKMAAEYSVDLVLIATHGRDGLARWRLGSVADKIVRQASCPTLVIGPNVITELGQYSLRRILVPLDGSALAEEAVTIATWIAERTGAELDLVRVLALPPVDAAMGAYPIDLLTAMEDSARAYLAERAEKLLGRVDARTALLIGSVPEELVDYAATRPADLVIMASHGREGLARAILGSVTDGMLHGPAPVLVLRPEEVRSGLVEIAKAQSWRSHIHRVRARQHIGRGEDKSKTP